MAFEKSVEWFGCQKSEKLLQTSYSYNVRFSRNKETCEPDRKYPPRMKVKLPYSSGNFLCDFYDSTKEKIDLQTEPIDTILCKGTNTRLVLQFIGLWFTKSGFGCSWKVVQAEIERSRSFDTYCFVEDEEYNKEYNFDNL